MAIMFWIPVSVYFVLQTSAARVKHTTYGACDLTELNMKKYGKLIKKEACPASGCKFWDSCPMEGETCSSGCLPYSEALGLTLAQRATKSIGHSLSGSCEKVCRYTDAAMLKTAEDGGAFTVTSAAVLESKLALMESGCGNMFNSMKATCGARQRKIGSIFGFLVHSLFEASRYGRAGEVSKCNTLLPPEIRIQLSRDLNKIIDSMVATGKLDAKKTQLIRLLGQFPSRPSLCEKLAKMGDTQIAGSNVTALKEALQQAANGKLSPEAVGTAVATVEKMGAEKIITQTLDEDQREVDAALVETSGNSTSLAQVDSSGFLLGLWAGFWSLFLHATIGTIMGTVGTALCLVSAGFLTDELGMSDKGTNGEFYGYRRAAWLVTCPLAMYGSSWGLRGKNKDPFSDLGFDWKSVADVFTWG